MSNLKKHRGLKRAFSLLEVMAAMAILAVSLVAIYNAQTQAMKTSLRTEYITTAMNLAKARLGELELEILDKGFGVLEDKEDGRFEDSRFGDYRWEYTSGKITIPLVSISKEAKEISENSVLKMAQDMLERSIKEVRMKVFFRDGKKEDFVELVTHFNDPSQTPIGQTLSKIGEGTKKGS